MSTYLPQALPVVPKKIHKKIQKKSKNPQLVFDINNKSKKTAKLCAVLREIVDYRVNELSDMVGETIKCAYDFIDAVDVEHAELIKRETNNILKAMGGVALETGWVPDMSALSWRTEYRPEYIETDSVTINPEMLYSISIEYAGAKYVAEVLNGKRAYDDVTICILDNIGLVKNCHGNIDISKGTTFDDIKSQIHKRHVAKIRPNNANYAILCILPQMDVSIYENAKAIFEALSTRDGKKFNQIISDL